MRLGEIIFCYSFQLRSLVEHLTIYMYYTQKIISDEESAMEGIIMGVTYTTTNPN